MGINGEAKKQTNDGDAQRDKDLADSTKHANKQRKRTKKLISQLREQIEFYFSDSNLQKDRFLKQEIIKNQNGYIPIKTIADFNRMKQMTGDIGLVIKAMKTSTLLEVNDGDTMVKRKAPIPEAKNVDAETIYVENLPPHTDHDFLRKIFSQFGNVTYVSIPRFKHTQDIKGFAFIEFETANEANDAVKAFPNETQEESNTDNQDEETKIKRRKRSHSESDVESNKQGSKTERKRRRTTSESSADSQGSLDSPKKKRAFLPDIKIKIEEEPEQSETVDGDKGQKRKKNDKSVHWKQEQENLESVTKEKGTKTTQSVKKEEEEEECPTKKQKSTLSDSNSEYEDKEGTDKKKAKKKKRKRKVKEKKETKLPQFKVIPKIEWMHLKQEYKKLQRESMQELKKQLQDNSGAQDGDKQKPTCHQSTQPNQQDAQKKKKKEDSGHIKELPFTPGVVLHFKCTDGNDLSKSEIRTRVTAHAPLAYVDVKEGTGEGFIRFHTAENCTTVLDNIDVSSGLKLDKLIGEKEREYWRKINADRLERFRAKHQKKRGTEKIANKVDALQVNQQVTHIRFDE